MSEIPNILPIVTPEFLLPEVLTIHQQLTTRIFDQGLDASLTPIGEYSSQYIKTRQRAGLGGSSKVILQFTGQMRNDFQVKVEGEVIGHGFNNPANEDKAGWVEDTYDKVIFALSDNEENLLSDLISKKIETFT